MFLHSSQPVRPPGGIDQAELANFVRLVLNSLEFDCSGGDDSGEVSRILSC